jgi:excisionase family DNA binding protein
VPDSKSRRSDSKQLLTIRELAERLNIAEGTAYHWLSAGRLTCVRFSRRCIRFRESDVQQLLDDLTNHKSTVTRSFRRNS